MSPSESGTPREQLTESALVLRSGLALSDLSVSELWVQYVSLGGTMTGTELTAALRGAREVSDHEHNLLAQALNDHFTEHGHDHPVAYSEDLDRARSRPTEGTRPG